MAPLTDRLSVYRELADHYERLGQVAMRDRFLILAADVALQSGQAREAEQLRQRLLHGSRHHMLRSYASFAEASAAPDVQAYLRDLRVNYPLEVAREMLGDLQPSGEPEPRPGPLPPTAPLMDLYGQPARPGALRPTGLAEPYPLSEDLDQTPAPPKPLAQPLPARAAARRAVAAPAAVPLPLPRPEAPAEEAANAAGWFSVALGGLVGVAAIVAAGYTLARPFLP